MYIHVFIKKKEIKKREHLHNRYTNKQQKKKCKKKKIRQISHVIRTKMQKSNRIHYNKHRQKVELKSRLKILQNSIIMI